MFLLNITSHSVVKRFRGTRDEYDEFELEAQMGHRIDPTPLTKRPTGGFQITVVDYGRGANANFRVGGLNSQSLVEELRGYIQARTGVPTGLHLLAYSSKALIDGNSLGSYGIEEVSSKSFQYQILHSLSLLHI
jgi:hypothetical protein